MRHARLVQRGLGFGVAKSVKMLKRENFGPRQIFAVEARVGLSQTVEPNSLECHAILGKQFRQFRLAWSVEVGARSFTK